MAARSFGPDARLHTRAEFLRVQNGGRRVSARYFTMLGQPAPGTRDRFGIVASRKVGGAVVRNRAKRRLRAIFRQCPSDTSQPMDIVVIARPALVDAPFADLTADFTSALQRLRGVSRR